MKLADLIPERMEIDSDMARGYNLAVDGMEHFAALAEGMGYRLVLAMPQHIEPMEEA